MEHSLLSFVKRLKKHGLTIILCILFIVSLLYMSKVTLLSIAEMK